MRTQECFIYIRICLYANIIVLLQFNIVPYTIINKRYFVSIHTEKQINQIQFMKKGENKLQFNIVLYTIINKIYFVSIHTEKQLN